MKNLIKLVTIIAAAFMFSSCNSSSIKAPQVVLDTSYYTDIYGWNAHGGLAGTMLGRGINMGNFLEAPVSDGGEGGWTGGRKIQKNDFSIIKQAGFKTVRIPVRWSDRAGKSAPYTIDPAFMARVKQVVGWAREQGLRVIINVHHYNEMMDHNNSKPLSYHRERLKAVWGQICDNFSTRAYPVNRVVFELLNEPNGRAGYTEWNDMIRDLTALIWTEKKQTGRKIMIGTANWGGVPGLARLSLPAACNKRNTIITIHYYEPFHFTHQGAEWVDNSRQWIGTPWTGSGSDRHDFTALLDKLVSWNARTGRGFEVFIGEFGVYSKYAAPSHQKAWTAFLTREAEKRNFSWAYWEFCSGFGAYDPAAHKWRSHLIKALVPAGK